MTEYQTHTALVATLETEIVRLRAVNAELRVSIQAPAEADTKLVQAARLAVEVLSELAEWESEGDPRHPATTAITALREALEEAPEPAAIPAEWLEEAFRDGWAMCRDSEIVGEEEEDWAFANSTTNSRMIDAQQAAPQPARQPLTDKQIASACLSYRHDFGLLPKQKQESIIFQAREWERALGKEREIGGDA